MGGAAGGYLIAASGRLCSLARAARWGGDSGRLQEKDGGTEAPRGSAGPRAPLRCGT